METSNLLNLLFFVALAMLLFISGGILYLSAAQWRDRRRQKRDQS
ncbi:MAG: hypothetical protein SAJ12_22100 [Jaaginema sp. PMC 1079.18]|nr:hypothetical protein [Jaaginema sp. PMC 1080.18]MEC4853684.1 hypothetical protein [Jaaginema sp. PMC 1079.18]MEC4867351.1 hypothetical protein [Jaaginema sp. PMC 1078.18]